MVADITREQLLEWARTPEAAGDLPRLVRFLILETTSGVRSIDFPGGGGIASGGFDGVADASSSNAFVPPGLSVWELSVEEGANRKADDDYAKRTAEPGDTPVHDCTYVQLIARPWIDHDAWATAKAQDGRWKSVRAYNVDSLEAWLQLAPGTTAWLARRLGLPTAGVIAASDWLEAWADATEPPTTAGIVLAGRDGAVDKLRGLLAGRPRIITVGGEAHPEELRAFVAAAIDAPDASPTGELALFVDDRASFERLLTHPTGAVLIVPDATWLPVRVGPHHVIVPVRTANDCDVVVPPVSGSQISELLQVEGIERRDAEELGELARRSLLAFRRRVAVQRAIHRPPWAEPPVDRMLRRLLLADRWHDHSQGDHDALARLAGEDYAAVEDQLTTIAGTHDPMIAVVDRLWHVVSPKDTWYLLAERLTRTDLEAFRAVALDVLGERDPSLDLPHDERWLASMRGLRRRFSVTLRQGLAHTVAKLGAYDTTIDTGGGLTGQGWADQIVRELLNTANADPSAVTWASLAPQLPLLAEAAPTIFLQAVAQGLSGEAPVLGGLFQDHGQEGPALPASSPHADLLWALERIAWAPEYFDAAVSLLAMLAELDPGGRLTNRPDESLASIFCPWLPHTSATEEQRMATLERLRHRFPEVTWELLLSQLPESHAVQLEQNGAEYRGWGRERPAVTRAEYLRVVESVASMLIAWLPDRSATATDLVERADDLPPNQRRSLAAALMDMAAPEGPLTGQQRAALWEGLRSLVAKHREYGDAQWALPEAELEPLVQAMELLEPADPPSRHAWLFDDGLVTLGDLRRRDDHEAYEAALRSRRRAAIGEVLEHGGLEGVTAFARQVTVPHYVGFALGEVGDASLDEQVLALLASDDERVRGAAHGYIVCRFRSDGWEWLDALLAALDEPSPTIVARALLASRDPVGGPSRADEADPAVRDLFWSEFSYVGLGDLDASLVDQLARSLLARGRPAAALDLLVIYQRRRTNRSVESAQLVADALEALLSSPDHQELHRLSGYDFEQLFSVLAEHRDAVGRDRVIRIEWAFAPALGYEPDLRSTYATMGEEPGLFVELVALQHPSDHEPPSDDQRRAAENAFRVLSGWRACPASSADGSIDSEALRAWVEHARASFKARELTDVGDRKIGETLAHAAADARGNWPPTPVRDLMEVLANDTIERGFELQTYNNRGTHWRDSEGGDQERDLAAKYRAHAEQARLAAPRVARVLDRLAETYEVEARQHDDEAERRRRGLGF